MEIIKIKTSDLYEKKKTTNIYTCNFTSSELSELEKFLVII